MFDTQLGFSLLARYGQEAPSPLERIELTIERRIRLYADRLARRLAELGDDDPYDLDDDRDLAGLLMLLCEAALDMDERNSGLGADPLTGQLRSREVADEEARRRLMQRDDTQQ